MREIFNRKDLHLGHYAKSFALRDPPRRIGGVGKTLKEKNPPKEHKNRLSIKRLVDCTIFSYNYPTLLDCLKRPFGYETYLNMVQTETVSVRMNLQVLMKDLRVACCHNSVETSKPCSDCPPGRVSVIVTTTRSHRADMMCRMEAYVPRLHAFRIAFHV